MVAWLVRLKNIVYQQVLPKRFKHKSELEYWSGRKEKEGRLDNRHYEYFFTEHFFLPRQFYQNKRVLDIGCGPRGSLEWADMTLERIGLDPLADKYKQLGTTEHKMNYVVGSSDKVPFSDGYFDIVTSFNSLDHVNDLNRTINEINRVVKGGGLFLLLCDVNHSPTACEPIQLSWNILDRFKDSFDVLDERHFERASDGLYESIHKGKTYDHTAASTRGGVLTAKLRKK